MIRAAQASDVNAVTALIIAAIGELTILYTGESSVEKATPILAQFYLQAGNRFSKELIKVDEQAGQVTGMILCYSGQAAKALYAPIEHYRSEALEQNVQHQIESEEDEYYIDALAVAEQHQGKGIAAQLMLQAEQDAVTMGFNKVSLLVDVDKTRARDLYLRKGFQQIGQKMLHRHPYWHMVKHV
jgi:ribosomal protein S18 acetylase RimI-like enzyme